MHDANTHTEKIYFFHDMLFFNNTGRRLIMIELLYTRMHEALRCKFPFIKTMQRVPEKKLFTVLRKQIERY